MAAINLNEKEFKDNLQSGKVMLVDYWAPWCGYCRRIAPAYEKVAQEQGERLMIAKLNIDEAPLVAAAENIEVIPTLVLYRDGQAIASIVAPESKAAIDAFIQENL